MRRPHRGAAGGAQLADRSSYVERRRYYFLNEFIGDRVALNNLSVRCFGRQTDRKRYISIGSTEIRDRIVLIGVHADSLDAGSFLFSANTLNHLTISAARSGDVAKCTRYTIIRIYTKE